MYDAEYQGKQVTLNKPFRTLNESKKFAVYVKNDEGNVIIVRFGDPDMEIKRDDKEARKAFRARHNCGAKTDKTTAGYWSCKFWGSENVSELLDNETIVTMNDKTPIKITNLIDNVSGVLTVDAVIARTGIQKYLASELGEDGNEVVGVFRPEKEVLAQKSLDTFVNIPVTDNHPNEMVTIDNYNKYARGSISIPNVVQLEGEKALATKLTITDKDLIEAVKSGKKELSVGYTNVLVKQDGEYKGEKYSYIQTDIVANHVAVVDAGRCGAVCKMAVDSKEGLENMKITINGKEYEVDEAVGKYIEGLKDKSKDMEELEKEKESMDAQLTKVKAQLDVAKTKQTNDTDISKMVNERVELLKMADSLGDKVACKPCMDNLTIKKLIVESMDVKTDGKSEDYLDAVIEVKKTETADRERRKQEALDSHNGAGSQVKTIDYNSIEETEI